MRMKPVKAWAAYRDGKFHDVFNPRIYRTQRGAKFYAGDDEVRPVRIVPESEYRRMMAAVRYVEAIASGKGADVRFKLGGEYMKAKRKER